MPVRNKVATLPPAVRKWLDEKLADGSFSNYTLLTEELKGRGYDLSRSSVHRYGSKLEKTMELARATVEKAKAVVQASPDEDDAMTAAIMRLTQQNTLEMLMAMEFDPEQAKNVDMNKLTLQVSRLVRTSIPLKNYQREQRERAKVVAADITKEARKMGASEDVIKSWREKVLGVANK
ncbi:MAG: DUF3486 family protein [Burkholderiaceae bacterium]|nr:DUF3486 family protein [Burkholderiaceae bacterium]